MVVVAGKQWIYIKRGGQIMSLEDMWWLCLVVAVVVAAINQSTTTWTRVATTFFHFQMATSLDTDVDYPPSSKLLASSPGGSF